MANGPANTSKNAQACKQKISKLLALNLAISTTPRLVMENSLIQARIHRDETMIEDPPRLKVTVIAVLGYTAWVTRKITQPKMADSATLPYLTFSGVKCRYGYASHEILNAAFSLDWRTSRKSLTMWTYYCRSMPPRLRKGFSDTIPK